MKTQNANPPAGSIYERFARGGRGRRDRVI